MIDSLLPAAGIGSHHLAQIPWAPYYFALFGLLTLAGGIMGYVKARSVASLVAGAVSGVLLTVGALLLIRGVEKGGGALLLCVSLLLLGRFTPSLWRGKLNPAVYVAPLSLVGAFWAAMILFAKNL